MRVPNWQHHSKKEQKRHLKPQALRQARKRSRQLTKCLLNRPKGRFRCYNIHREKKISAHEKIRQGRWYYTISIGYITKIRFNRTRSYEAPIDNE